MSKNITAEDCRKLLSGEVKDKKLTRELINSIRDLSVSEKFNLAKELLQEISFYYKLDSQLQAQNKALKLSSIRASALTPLILSFEFYDSISTEEYEQLMENNSYVIMASLMKNDSFPITFLIHDSWIENHLNEPKYWYMKEYVSIIKKSRKSEIVSYYRNLVPNSESMSDEMVMSIAGAKI